MQRYEHREPIARWMVALLAITVALILGIAFRDPGARPALPALLVVVLVFVLFSALQTTVDASAVSWAFARGWPAGRMRIDEIVAARIVQVPFLQRCSAGIGLNSQYGTLWTVGSSHAVELTAGDGRRVALATGDPQGLLDAIDRFRRGAA